VLLGGGGILYDADARLYLREVLVAKEHGVPVMLYAVGAAAEGSDGAGRGARSLEGVAAITGARKERAAVLEEAGVHHDVVVTADPALLLKPESLPRNALKFEGLADRAA